jgi:hypothetical protein
MALVLWIHAAAHPSVERLVGALVTTGVADAWGVILWWMAVRPRLVLTDGELLVVNPWGSERVAVGGWSR